MHLIATFASLPSPAQQKNKTKQNKTYLGQQVWKKEIKI